MYGTERAWSIVIVNGVWNLGSTEVHGISPNVSAIETWAQVMASVLQENDFVAYLRSMDAFLNQLQLVIIAAGRPPIRLDK